MRVPRLRALHAVAICAPFGGSMDNLNNLDLDNGSSDNSEEFNDSPDYNKYYRIFKKLPVILTIINSIIVIVASIILGIQLGALYAVISLPLGALLVGLTYFFSAMHVSAIVLRTDAMLELKEKVEKIVVEMEND